MVHRRRRACPPEAGSRLKIHLSKLDYALPVSLHMENKMARTRAECPFCGELVEQQALKLHGQADNALHHLYAKGLAAWSATLPRKKQCRKCGHEWGRAAWLQAPATTAYS